VRFAQIEMFAAFVSILMVLGVAFLSQSIHCVKEGHVGVYWRGGALVPGITDPGYHLKLPFVTKFENVQVTVQTDKVLDVPCGTSGGVLIVFDKIEVVNRLRREFVYDTVKNYTTDYDKPWIFDKIHHEINQFCSMHTLQEVNIDLFPQIDERLVEALQRDAMNWAPGIQIISIRLTKPRIPVAIAQNYEKMEAEKSRLKFAEESQKVLKREAETEKMKAEIEAQKKAEVSRLAMQQQIAEKEAQQKMEAINDAIALAHAKGEADARFYAQEREAESNRLKLTPEYLQLELIKALANNSKFYYGDKLSFLGETRQLFNSLFLPGEKKDA